jgi:hypothetical protein
MSAWKEAGYQALVGILAADPPPTGKIEVPDEAILDTPAARRHGLPRPISAALEEAITTVIGRVTAWSALQRGSDFKSIVALRIACDPDERGVVAAANNRAGVRRLAADPPPTDEWRVTQEEIDFELAELAAAGRCRVAVWHILSTAF